MILNRKTGRHLAPLVLNSEHPPLQQGELDAESWASASQDEERMIGVLPLAAPAGEEATGLTVRQRNKQQRHPSHKNQDEESEKLFMRISNSFRDDVLESLEERLREDYSPTSLVRPCGPCSALSSPVVWLKLFAWCPPSPADSVAFSAQKHCVERHRKRP